jgi:hypothetical protein
MFPLVELIADNMGDGAEQKRQGRLPELTAHKRERKQGIDLAQFAFVKLSSNDIKDLGGKLLTGRRVLGCQRRHAHRLEGQHEHDKQA